MADNFFGVTDTGKVRDNNEDTFIAQQLPNGRVLACVIDGVGGYEGGEVAAAIARETILAKLHEEYTNATGVLKEAILGANQNIYTEKQKAGAGSSMACVLTMALADVENNQFYYAHVGDTRMYLLRDGSLVKVTKDHSFVGFLEDSGRLSEKEAMQHPKRNEINKALGFDAGIQLDDDYIESGSSPFLPGDVLLLCSDGLTDMVDNKGMTEVLLSGATLQQKGEDLIAAANAAGGKDNITAVLVANNKKPLKQKATRPASLVKKKEAADEAIEPVAATEEADRAVKRKRNHIPILALSFLCLLLAAAACWLWKQNKELTMPPAPIVKRLPAEGEKSLSDSLSIARKRLVITDSLSGKNIIIGDTLFIRQDSLHIVGNGATLQRDSTYSGPAFFVTANCRYLLLENINFKDFHTAIATQGKGLQLKTVVFKNVIVPVQQNRLLPLNDTLNGIFKDTFLIKKDTTRK